MYLIIIKEKSLITTAIKAIWKIEIKMLKDIIFLQNKISLYQIEIIKIIHKYLVKKLINL